MMRIPLVVGLGEHWMFGWPWRPAFKGVIPAVLISIIQHITIGDIVVVINHGCLLIGLQAGLSHRRAATIDRCDSFRWRRGVRRSLCLSLQQRGTAVTILNISAAARAAGVDRTTIQRAIKNGRLSLTRDTAGNRGVDVAELERVFGPLHPDSGKIAAAPLQTAEREVIDLLREQLAQAQADKARLLGLLEQAQEARRVLEQKLLEGPKTPPEAAPETVPKAERGFWRRLWRRS
jgi:hypothetical protein